MEVNAGFVEPEERIRHMRNEPCHTDFIVVVPDVQKSKATQEGVPLIRARSWQLESVIVRINPHVVSGLPVNGKPADFFSNVFDRKNTFSGKNFGQVSFQ